MSVGRKVCTCISTDETVLVNMPIHFSLKECGRLRILASHVKSHNCCTESSAANIYDYMCSEEYL